LYDRLLELDDSPVIALNRAVAVANVHGPQAGIEAVERIENGSQLKSYYLLYAVLGEFEKQLNNFQAAIDNFRKALELTELTSEQLFLSKRLRDSEERRLRVVA
jgi:RNA polymerase sigma-70 factor (ECF subfamily)